MCHDYKNPQNDANSMPWSRLQSVFYIKYITINCHTLLKAISFFAAHYSFPLKGAFNVSISNISFWTWDSTEINTSIISSKWKSFWMPNYQLSMMKILYIWIRCLWIRFVPINTSNMFKNSFLCDLWHILVSHSLGKFLPKQ